MKQIEIWSVKPEHRRKFSNWRWDELCKAKGFHLEAYELKRTLSVEGNEILASLEEKGIVNLNLEGVVV